jgi:hypothetical protein
MAFTEQAKADIRFFMGYPDVYRYINSRLENAIEVVGTHPEAQARVELILLKLNTLFGSNANGPIANQVNFAGMTKVESRDDIVEFGNASGNGGSQIAVDQNAYGNMLCGMLAKTFAVDLGGRIFSSSGYEGDRWMSTNNMSNKYFLMGI